MDVTELVVEKAVATAAYQEYLKHRHYETPVDAEIKRIYAALAKGKTVIRALESIVKAGADGDGLPLLSIARADQTSCLCHRDKDGSFVLIPPGRRRGRVASDLMFSFPARSLPPGDDPQRATRGGWWADYEAMVPLIPISIRPRHGIANYHVLWEVERWRRTHVPKDPYLLRRLGKGDAWLVVGAWDLTEVERAVLQSRVSVN